MYLIRPFQSTDLPNIRSLHQINQLSAKQAMLSPAELPHLGEIYGQPGHDLWILHSEPGELIGMGGTATAVTPTHRELRHLCIHPRYQRQGWGRTLLQHIEGVARATAVTHLGVQLPIRHKEEQHFYLHQGFYFVRRELAGESGDGWVIFEKQL